MRNTHQLEVELLDPYAVVSLQFWIGRLLKSIDH